MNKYKKELRFYERVMNKLLSENVEERVIEMTKLESEGYSIKKILEFCKLNCKTVYNIRFVKIPMKKTIYIGNIILNYEIYDDFPEALDNYGTRDLHRIIGIWDKKDKNIENSEITLLSNDIIDFERSWEDETAYYDFVQAMNIDIDIVFDKILNCKEQKINLSNCLDI